MRWTALVLLAWVAGSCTGETEPDPWPGPPNDRLFSAVRHTCALSNDDRLWCWGQYGPQPTGVRSIEADDRNTWLDAAYIPPSMGTQTPLCALATDHTLWRGYLGDLAQVPTDDTRLKRVAGVGLYGCCGVTDDGLPWCDPETHVSFEDLWNTAGKGNLVEIAGTHSRLCVLTEHRNLFCATNPAWHRQENQNVEWVRIADGVIDFKLWPRTNGAPGRLLILGEDHRVRTTNLETNQLQQAVEGDDWGDLARSCAVKLDETLWCGQTILDPDRHPGWGEETQIGDWEDGPEQVVSSIDHAWRDVAVGLSHACAMTSGGAVYCVGDNRYDQLAQEPPPGSDEPRDHYPSPVRVRLAEEVDR